MLKKKKLIEVALPLEAINDESAREKSIRHGHPSTLHLWWARRPLAAARAVIWSSLVDDPSSLPEQFPTEEAQNAERQRLFGILERLVKWENSNNEDVLNAAKAEILKSTDGNPPALLDPFAGGGAIPLEAQRLGLEAHASDLNPVAVMINKAMIEIPPKFAGQPPVNPESSRLMNNMWTGASGLAEDVRYYGEWMKKEAFKRIGHLYPMVKDDLGHEHAVIAWIWARTVKCPNPACGCEMPLASSFELSKKKGREAYIQPVVEYPGNANILGNAGVSPATSEAWRSRGYIPHIDILGLIQSITFRLNDSVPAKAVENWKTELLSRPEAERDAELQKRIDKYENAGYGNCYLKMPEIAETVEKALLFFDNERYMLLDWCIMPNHVHVLIETIDNHRLSDIVHSWKSYTAKSANHILGLHGEFWAPEYFDRYVRDDGHLAAVREYIRSNPVKAGLVYSAEDWLWSSAKLDRASCGRDVRVPRIRYEVRYGKGTTKGTVNRTGAWCIACGQPVELGYIRSEAKVRRMGVHLMAIVAEGSHGRLFLAPDKEQVAIAACKMPENVPTSNLPEKALGFRIQAYGMAQHKDLFTNRQLTAIATFSGLIEDLKTKVI
jgi:adenine-specific DNA methylase/REP element-mobilizing transposase RayT